MPDNGSTQAKAATANDLAAAQATKRLRIRLLIRAAGMLPVLLLLCAGFHYLSDGRFFTGQNPASSCSRLPSTPCWPLA